MPFSLNQDETDFCRLFRGWDVVCLFRGWGNCGLLAPHTKYGMHACNIFCWLMLVSATVICTHADSFQRQTQNSLTLIDQLLIRIHYPTGLGLTITRSSVWLQASPKPAQCSL